MFLLIPLFVAMLAGFGGTAIYQRATRATWREVRGTPGGTPLLVGGTYRTSVDDVGASSPEGVTGALEAAGFWGVVTWSDGTYPSDWPDHDRGPGRTRTQFTIPQSVVGTFGAYVWFPPGGAFRAWELRNA